ncbi:hypothetical protein SAMN05518669_103335 [Variovorax sp. YR634]|uniref:hypothetical protein n=1 Tax=Variovorax sp. YR634 TaxID=1884385 RepID=UPI000896CE8F|nr:hypothetical protein [Variovorax sp. YR634]SDX11950.1 hypothetical protein SAMN05518669_103335 [Variovorax sp. YR634]
MNSDLDVDERRAAAQPRDWPDDFDKPTRWNVCGGCNRVFLGTATRMQCRLCAGRRTV